ncbi:MAG: DUF2157 domain-containing protein [Gemmatimonadota bacterium]|nr:DUF2157 domain-containing protein [Gemmatimonadota bacterium]
MIRNEKKWLEARLEEWVGERLIAGDQAEAIRVYQGEKPERQWLSFFGLLVGVGALSVGIGTILVVSYNWERIPPVLRQLGFLLALAGVAEGMARSAGNRIAGPALGVIWVLLPLAGIGLWGQVYQLSGDAFTPLAVTLMLALPVVWIGRHASAAAAHALVFVWTIFVGVLEPGSWISMRGADALRTSWLAVVAVVLWAAMLHQTRRLSGPAVTLLLWMAFLVFMFTIAGNWTGFDIRHEGIHFVVAGALTMIFWVGEGVLGLSGRRVADVGWFATACFLYVLSFFHHGVGIGGGLETAGLYYAAVLSVAGVVCLARADMDEVAGAGGPHVARVLLALPWILSALLLGGDRHEAVGYLANFVLVVFCLYTMHSAVLRADRRRVNAAVFVLGLLMLTRIMDYFGSLLTSGSAFLVLGFLFLAMAYGLNRGRRHVLEQVERGGEA